MEKETDFTFLKIVLYYQLRNHKNHQTIKS